jgi:23S rRNA (guanine2445-N2)-methyltransferase / 23S rRNA (guanine2069-N7)-methyltransferase
VLADELRALDIEVTEVRSTAVLAAGALRDGYRACLRSRIASRVLLSLAQIDAEDDVALYDAIAQIAWWEHFDVSKTFAIGSSQAAHSPFPAHFWVQRAKDAIVDSFRTHTGSRPSIDKKNPSIRFHLHVGERHHELGLDFSGTAQHRRGYRRAAGKAPLKENLAAAILHLAGWPAAAAEGLALVDPTCGSGTFLVEAALMATHRAPGLLRDRFGFESWLRHEPEVFGRERAAAEKEGKTECPAPIFGYDASAEALSYARDGLRAAGVEQHVTLAQKDLSVVRKPTDRGIVVCNPPYGHRLGDQSTIFLFYQALGDTLKQGFDGWTAYVFAAHGEGLKHLGLRSARRHVLYNGAIECRLLEIPLHGPAEATSKRPSWRKPSPKAQMFVNRVKKNRKRWERWAERNAIECYRLYDADIPEYDIAVDRYGSKAVVHLFEDQRDIGHERARQRIQDVLLTLPEALGIDSSDVVIKVRRRHDQGDQYARLSQRAAETTVAEGTLRFIVSLEDRIDTGLFLDHRAVRAYALAHCSDKRVLNLFAYTCSVSVAAAAGGAAQTTSVDLSNTYLQWGKRNFRLNGIDPDRHRFIRDDALSWLTRQRSKFDWIFINPPTFSRSKMSKGDFNVHDDHVRLIELAMRCLHDGGELLFTTHAKGFALDREALHRFRIEDTTRALVPPDFTRHPFRAFRISKGVSSTPPVERRGSRSRAGTSARRPR